MKYSALILALLSFFAVSIDGQASLANVQELHVVTFLADKKTLVSLSRDPDFPNVTGRAEVDLNTRGVASVKAEFKKLPTVFDLKGQYSTYVLWAVYDDGTTENIGSVRSSNEGFADRSFEDNLTRGKSFGLILTAEPHYLVREPSRKIVMRSGPATGENAMKTIPKKVQVEFSENDYSYERAKLDKKKEKEYRKTPLSLLAARYAVDLARDAGADTDASDLINQARDALEKLEQAWKSKAKAEEIDKEASSTIGLAANAEKRAIESRKSQKVEQEKTRAASTLDETEDNLRRAREEVERLKEDLGRMTSKRDSLERDFNQKNSQLERAEVIERDAVRKADVLAKENFTLNVEIEKLKAETKRYRDAKQFADEIPNLEGFLKNVGAVQRKPDGLTVTLGEAYWMEPGSEQFAEGASLEKIDMLAKKLAELKYIRVSVTSFVTALSEDTSGQSFAEIRAKAMSDYLKKHGVETERIAVPKGYLQSPPAGKPKKGPPPNSNRIEIDLVAIN